ncbi:MAG: hypothetical protein HZB70_00680 [Candidatus Berkelbacteria bacterium]|nr:MAG: hypothetical protein HZB70_00680 [Candidatus Berkelbacteria bacterium]QQG51381.1 MAG: hypothetical protein HY845_02320 [Candidatus Berkelbacteria bacterium]
MVTEAQYADIPKELGLKISDIAWIWPDNDHGPIPVTHFADKILSTERMQRARHVAIQGLFTGMAAINSGRSVYEHTLGVYYQGLITTRTAQLRQYRLLQQLIDLAHDSEKAPFAHSLEPTQKLVLGGDHEELVAKLADEEIGEIAREFGLDFDEAAKAVRAKHPTPMVNDLLHSMFGSDSNAGTFHYARMQYNRNGRPYCPEAISYCVEQDDNGRLMLRDRDTVPYNLAVEVKNACDTRRQIFDLIYSVDIEGPEVLVARAAHFAFCEGLLDRAFFDMKDSEAAQFLLGCSCPQARSLTECASNNRHYERVYLGHFRWPTAEQLSIITDEPNQQVFADRVASELKIEPENVCIHMGRYKGVKDLSNVRIVTADGHDYKPPHGEQYPFVHAYLHPNHVDKREQLTAILDELLLIS